MIAKPASKKNIFSAAIIATLFVISIAGVYLLSNGLRFRYTDRQLYLAETDFSQNSLPKRTTDTCMVYKFQIESFNEDNCVHINEGKTNILLLGDSHAEHFRRALEDFSDNVSLSVATISGCRPTFPGVGRETCKLMMQQVYQQLIKDYEFDIVVVSARWSQRNIRLMPNAIDLLKANIDNVIVLGPIITYTQSLPILLARHGASLHQSGLQSKFTLYNQTRVIDQRFKNIAEENGAEYVSILDLMCLRKQCQLMTREGLPMQWDYGRLTYDGASELIKEIEPLLVRNNENSG